MSSQLVILDRGGGVGEWPRPFCQGRLGEEAVDGKKGAELPVFARSCELWERCWWVKEGGEREGWRKVREGGRREEGGREGGSQNGGRKVVKGEGALNRVATSQNHTHSHQPLTSSLFRAFRMSTIFSCWNLIN